MKTIEEIQKLIDMPYPTKTEESFGECIYDSTANFFRNTPVRKIKLIYDGYCDYENDDEMTEEIENEISTESENAYKQTRALLFDLLKQYPFQENKYPTDLDLANDNYSDETKEDTPLPGEELNWTPEYEGGIREFDEDNFTIWDMGNEYLYLSRSVDNGDGEVGYYTFICITPKINAKK